MTTPRGCCWVIADGITGIKWESDGRPRHFATADEAWATRGGLNNPSRWEVVQQYHCIRCEKTASLRLDQTGHLLIEQEKTIRDLWETVQILVERYPGCETVITAKEMAERSHLGVVVTTEVDGGTRLKVRQR